MKLMSFTKKKFVALAMAGGMAAGASGIAAAYLSATGTGTGSGSVVTSPTVTVVSMTATGWVPGTPFRVPFTVQNTNPGTVRLGLATISSATVGTCTTTSADTLTVTTGPATTPIGTVLGHGAVSGVHLAVKTPFFTVPNSATYTQAGCKVHLTITV